MLRLRPYNKKDAEHIVKWIGDELAFRRWSADRYDHFPISAEDMNRQYAVAEEADWYYPMVAFDESGVVGHLIMRFLDEEKTVLRFGFIIVDNTRRGEGLGKRMLQVALKYAFEILGARKVTLGVFANNPSALRCYQSVGFVMTKSIPGKVDWCGEDWTCLELEIQNSLT